HDQNHANPARGGNLFAEEPNRREGRKHEAQRGERPEETDFAFRHQNQQAAEKQRLEKHAEQDLRVGGAGFEDAENFTGGVAVHVADVRHALFQKDDAGGLEHESDEQNQKQFNHKFF